MLEPQEDMREEPTDEYGNPVSNKEMRRIREGPKEGRHRGDTAAVGFSLTPNGIVKSGDQGSFGGKQVPMAVVNNDSRGCYRRSQHVRRGCAFYVLSHLLLTCGEITNPISRSEN